MNPNTFAQHALTAAAFVVTAMVMLQASTVLENRAHAEMVVNKDAVTMITTQFRADSEILYVLDSRRGRLFAYVHNPSKRTIELLDSMDVDRAFAAGGGAEDTSRGGRTGNRNNRDR